MPLAKTLKPGLGFWATVKVLKITLKCLMTTFQTLHSSRPGLVAVPGPALVADVIGPNQPYWDPGLVEEFGNVKTG